MEDFESGHRVVTGGHWWSMVTLVPSLDSRLFLGFLGLEQLYYLVPKSVQ